MTATAMVDSNAVLLLRHGGRDWCRWYDVTAIPAVVTVQAVVAVQIRGELLMLRYRRVGVEIVLILLCKGLRLQAWL